MRQSSFALIGDLVKTCFSLVADHVSNIMQALVANMDPTNVSVCNNAIWAMGEISLKVGEHMNQYAPIIVMPLIEVMNKERVTRTLLENTGECACRAGRPACSDHARPAGPALRARDRATPAQLHQALVQVAAQHPRQRGEGVGLPRRLQHDPAEPAGRDPQLRVLLRRARLLEQPGARAAAQLPRGECGRGTVRTAVQILVDFQRQVGTEVWTQFVAQFPPTLSTRLQALYEL